MSTGGPGSTKPSTAQLQRLELLEDPMSSPDPQRGKIFKVEKCIFLPCAPSAILSTPKPLLCPDLGTILLRTETLPSPLGQGLNTDCEEGVNLTYPDPAGEPRRLRKPPLLGADIVLALIRAARQTARRVPHLQSEIRACTVQPSPAGDVIRKGNYLLLENVLVPRSYSAAQICGVLLITH